MIRDGISLESGGILVCMRQYLAIPCVERMGFASKLKGIARFASMWFSFGALRYLCPCLGPYHWYPVLQHR